MCNLTSEAVKPLFCSHLIGIQDWWGKTLSRQSAKAARREYRPPRLFQLRRVGSGEDFFLKIHKCSGLMLSREGEPAFRCRGRF